MTPVARRALASLSDRELIVETQRLADRERHATADVIAALMEFDERRLYLGEGCSSLFTYCTSVLRFSEHAAYGRIEAARAARRFPMILDMLANGELTLTAVNLLSAQLTLENHAEVLEAARYKSKREVEVLLSALRPRPDVPTAVRRCQCVLQRCRFRKPPRRRRRSYPRGHRQSRVRWPLRRPGRPSSHR